MKATIRDVAREAGVSISTVSKVMNHWKTISQETVERVQDAATKLGYTPNARAVNFARGNTHNVIYLSDLKKGAAYQNPHLFDIMCGVFSSLARNGYTMTLMDISNEDHPNETIENIIKEKSADGIVIHGSVINQEVANLIVDHQFPHIVIGHPDFDNRLCWIDTNHALAGQHAAAYLIRRKALPAVFIAGRKTDFISKERENGFRKCLRHNGYSLQNTDGQTTRLIEFRNKLVDMMSDKVKELNRDNFAVKQHLKYVDHYSNPVNYNSISYEDTLVVKEEVAPLVLPDYDDDVSAVRFDALIYGLELAQLNGKSYGKAKSDLMKKVKGISMISNIPEIQVKSELIDRILHTDYIERAGLDELEYVRENLRNLMKYLPKPISVRYDTDFSDDILSVEWNDSELENESLKNYKAKAEYYIRQHQDNIVIAKLKTNKPLTEDDIKTLESILWSDLGTKEDYEKEYGTKPLGEFVREIVGLDMNAAKEAFSDFLNDSNLDSRQIYFVNQIVEYIVHNGLLKDFSVLQESPFTDRGSVVEIFTDLNVWAKIRNVIEQINANAA